MVNLILSLCCSGEKPVAYPWMVHYYPEVAFSCILSVFFGIMALSTLRMKFLWTPHICMVGAGIFCHQDFWRWVFSSSKIKDGIVSSCNPLYTIVVGVKTQILRRYFSSWLLGIEVTLVRYLIFFDVTLYTFNSLSAFLILDQIFLLFLTICSFI